MALRTLSLRTVPILRPSRCHARHLSYIVQDLAHASSSAKPSSYPSQCRRRQCHDSNYSSFHVHITRSFSSSSSTAYSSKDDDDDDDDDDDIPGPIVLYEGPFASLTLKLKRISLTSAVIGIVGLPVLSIFYGGGGVPPTGQLAVIATAGVTAVGSTALLGYCFSPYVHTLERLPRGYNITAAAGGENEGTRDEADADDATSINNELLRIVTRDILARRVETIFDPTTGVCPPTSNNSRPFCNFMVKSLPGGEWLPMYVHPEMIHDHSLRVQLVGEEPETVEEDKKKKKWDDDEFL